MTHTELTKDHKTIFVCPLDWGLGHATRCIPIIQELLTSGFHVILGASGASLVLLRKEFPDLECIILPGYDIHYPADGSMVRKMIRQMPHIIKVMLEEKRVLKRLIRQRKIDGVISDNRFGLGTKAIPSVYMTHQIRIKAPSRLQFLEPAIYEIHRLFMNTFCEVWIPDFEGEVNLSGDLSHSYPPPLHGVYIGIQSRFEKQKVNEAGYDLLVLLSGPEPQRTMFENIVLQQLKAIPLSVLIVRGTPGAAKRLSGTERIEMVNHLPASELNRAMLAARTIVARAGYSTIMDLARLGKSAILVPTPGQTEQEYLARALMRRGFYYSELQKDLNLKRALTAINEFRGFQEADNCEKVLPDRIREIFL